MVSPPTTPPQKPAPSTAAAAGGTIVADKFSFWYGNKQALQDITLTMAPRAVSALIGPSGCGHSKSTFLRSINRMHALLPNVRHSGALMLDGVDVHSAEMDAVLLRRRVGMVFQRPNPFPKSIYDNVAYGPRIDGRNRETLDRLVESSLQRAALWDEVKDRLRESALGLSGGQQQRLCIARRRWPARPRSCCWTNRRAPSIRSPRRRSKSCSTS